MIPTVVVLVLLVSGAYAKNAAMTLMGSGSLTYDGSGKEFQNVLYQSACMQKQGWEVTSVNSEGEEGDSELQKSFESTLGKDTVKKVAPTTQIKDDKGDPRSLARKLSADAELKIREAIAKATEGLGPGDQFLFQLAAHGHSNCKFTDSYDLSQGAQDYRHCDHEFDFNYGGRSIKITTSQIIEALEPLKNRGIKLAVQLHTCHGGAAIKDFAEKGICAHAYATPDAPMIMCGGKSDTNEVWASSTPDLTIHSSCRHLADKEYEEITSKIGAAEDMAKCARMSREKLQAMGIPKNPSAAGLFDELRKADPTLNQPIGTDGPFWIFGNLGFLGLSGLSYDNNFKAKYQSKLESCESKDDYFQSMLSNFSEISQKLLGKECQMETEVGNFLKANDKDLSDYFKAFKGLNHILSKLQSRIKEKVPEKLRNEMIAEFKKEIEASPPAMQKEMKQQLIHDELGIIQRCLIDRRASCHQTVSAGLPQKDFQGLMDDIDNVLKNEAPKARANLRRSYQSKIMKLERRLYEHVKSSPTYAKCVREKPQLSAAKSACESFKMP